MNLRTYAVGAVILLLFVAGLFLAARLRASGPDQQGSKERGPQDPFVTVDPKTQDLLLDEWRWKVGPDAKVFRVTVFGDLFTQGPKGEIYWLDTGFGQYVEVAKSVEQWEVAAKSQGEEWFRWDALRKLRSSGVELKEGEVYSWRHSPMLGGAESAENVDVVSLVVHVAYAGRLAEQVKDLPPGTKIDRFTFEPMGAREGGEEPTVWEVVVNDAGQYSIWPAGQQVPNGWKLVGKRGSQQECLDYIAEVWTDVPPPS